MKRVVLGLGLVAAIIVATVWLVPRRADRPNVLLISLCSVRADHLGYHGYERDTTPTLDELAAVSTVFSNGITQWPKTQPAFAALMTGLYGHTNGIMRSTSMQNRLSDRPTTLAEALRSAGYRTAAFITSAALSKRFNLDQGFDVYYEATRPESRYETATEHALAWLDETQQAEQEPFFVWVHYNNAHYPYHRDSGGPSGRFLHDDLHTADRRQVPLATHDLELGIPANHPYRRQLQRADIGHVHHRAVLPGSPTDLGTYIAYYDAALRSADQYVGQLLDGATRRGLMEDTIVAVVGDHGEALGEHNYYFEHGRFPYDATVRVPFLIRRAGQTRGERIDAPVATFRLMPTLLDMVDVQRPQGMEATSLLPMMTGSSAEAAPAFFEAGYNIDYITSVRDGPWKLIRVPSETDRMLMTGTEYELYNVATDPAEVNNLYLARPRIAARLQSTLDQWAASWRSDGLAERPAHSASDAHEPGEDLIEQLRTLGYVD